MPRYSVLIADGDATFRDQALTGLAAGGLVCAAAADSREALELAQGHVFETALVSVQLAGQPGGGIAVLREIKRLTPLCEVLMLASHASVESGIESLKYGAFDYLVKPLDSRVLLERLDAAFAHRQNRQRKIAAQQQGMGQIHGGLV